LKKNFKNKICWWAYLNLWCFWMFSVQYITNITIKNLVWEAENLKKCVLRMQEMLFQSPKFLKISWGSMPPDPLANLRLRHSAHTFGDRILSWGGQGKWALWQFLVDSRTPHWYSDTSLIRVQASARYRSIPSYPA
jgi:hypothetical protein